MKIKISLIALFAAVSFSPLTQGAYLSDADLRAALELGSDEAQTKRALANTDSIQKDVVIIRKEKRKDKQGNELKSGGEIMTIYVRPTPENARNGESVWNAFVFNGHDESQLKKINFSVSRSEFSDLHSKIRKENPNLNYGEATLEAERQTFFGRPVKHSDQLFQNGLIFKGGFMVEEGREKSDPLHLHIESLATPINHWRKGLASTFVRELTRLFQPTEGPRRIMDLDASGVGTSDICEKQGWSTRSGGPNKSLFNERPRHDPTHMIQLDPPKAGVLPVDPVAEICAAPPPRKPCSPTQAITPAVSHVVDQVKHLDPSVEKNYFEANELQEEGLASYEEVKQKSGNSAHFAPNWPSDVEYVDRDKTYADHFGKVLADPELQNRVKSLWLQAKYAPIRSLADLGKFKSLSSLRLSEPSRTYPSQGVISALGQASHLKTLRVDGIILGTEPYASKAIGPILENKTRLQRLHLGKSLLDDDSMKSLKEALTQNSQLRELKLTDSHFSGEVGLSELLAAQKGLETLELDSDLTSTGVEKILRTLNNGDHGNLKKINIRMSRSIAQKTYLPALEEFKKNNSQVKIDVQ